MNADQRYEDRTMGSAHKLIEHHHVHLLRAARLDRGEIKAAVQSVSGLNRKTAIFVPAVLGSMPFFWFTVVLACCSLPAVLTLFDTEVLKGTLGFAHFFPTVILKASVIGLIAWIAQTAIQLWALPVLQVSSNATQAQLEGHVAVILDRLDEETPGGLQVALEARDTVLAVAKKLDVDLS